MLEVIDTGVAHMTKRDKMRHFYGRILPDGMPNDQDANMIDDELQCYAVADGVGGSIDSDKASKAVVAEYQKVIRALYASQSFTGITQQEYMMSVLGRLNASAVDTLATTTFTGVAIHPDGSASYLHVGDSQLLLYRHDELIYCTSEHVNEDGYGLLNYLGIQPEWAAQGYARHALNVTLKANSFSQTKLEAEWGEILLQEGDRFALITDGIAGSNLNEKLDEVIIKRSLNRRMGAAACADALLAASRKEDDSTAIVVDIGMKQAS